MTAPLRDDPRHRELRLRGPTKHCGRSMCVRTLPSPEDWDARLTESPGYDPECVCPCLDCHPVDVDYQAALDVVRKVYGRTAADTMEMARRMALAAHHVGAEPTRTS
jgi:hypothetical protein